MAKTPPDDRDPLWAELEKDIQDMSKDKDSAFRLKGSWKKFVRMQDGFKVYAVDGDWVRRNLSVIFGHGGHGIVHEFIPMDEIWIGTRHYHMTDHLHCGCPDVRPNQEVSPQYFDSCTHHEITEHLEMKKGKPYWAAHDIANEAERKLGLIADPEGDTPVVAY